MGPEQSDEGEATPPISASSGPESPEELELGPPGPEMLLFSFDP